MMAPLLASVLGAVALPRAPDNANLIIHAPRLDQLAGVLAFFEAAGKRAPLLRPSSWRSDFHPILDVDIGQVESVKRAGIDPASWATVSFLGEDRITCTTLRDAKAFESRASQRLASLGKAWTSQSGGSALHGAASQGRVVAGYAIRRQQACAVSSARNAEALLKQAAKLLATAPDGRRWPGLESIPGRVYLISPHFTVGLTGSSATLSIAGRATEISSPRLKPIASSPYPETAAGLLFVRAHMESVPRALVESSVVPDLKMLCSGCDERDVHQLFDAALPSLTGNVLLRVDGARLSGSLKSPWERYFAVKHAYLAEIGRPDGFRQALDRAAAWPNARKTAEGIALSVQGGEIQIGLRGSQLYIGNDPGAVKRALQTVSGQIGKLNHGAEFSIDAPKISRTLSQVSLLDAIGSRDLAPLLVVSSEVGPLLDASRPLKGWAETASDGSQRFALTWTLLP